MWAVSTFLKNAQIAAHRRPSTRIICACIIYIFIFIWMLVSSITSLGGMYMYKSKGWE